MKFLISIIFLFAMAAQAQQVILNGKDVTIDASPGQTFEAIRTAQTPSTVKLYFAPHSVPYEVCDQTVYYRYVCGHYDRCTKDPQHEGRNNCTRYPTYCDGSRCVSSHVEYRTEYQSLTMNFKSSLPLTVDQRDVISVNVYSNNTAGVTVLSSVYPYIVKQGGTVFNAHSWYFTQGDQKARH